MPFPIVTSSTRLTPRDVPPVLRGLIGVYLPPENIDRWLQDQDAFGGRSALDLLSLSHQLQPAAFEANVREIVELFYEVLAFATTPELPAVAEVAEAVRQAQKRIASERFAAFRGQRLFRDPQYGCYPPKPVLDADNAHSAAA